jgi:hypothetical protein
MKTRCLNPKADKYKSYGGRGITVCDEWLKFRGFSEWARISGYSVGLQIDRVDNDKGYSPDNCRLVTPIENARNKRNTRRIKSSSGVESIGEVAERTGLKHSTVYERIRRGWSGEKAVSDFVRGKDPLKKIAESKGVPYPRLRVRLSHGWSLERALNTPIRKLKKRGGCVAIPLST